MTQQPRAAGAGSRICPNALTVGGPTLPTVTSWQCTVRFDPTRDGDEEDGAGAVAADGVTTWWPAGATATIEGGGVGVWALGRHCMRPFAVHHHTRDWAARAEDH